MDIVYPANKKIVCITGTVWTGDHDAPRKKLVKAGFIRPSWFTTERGITDAHYQRISSGQYHLSAAEGEVMIHIKYGAGHIGIMKQDFSDALQEATQGILIVGPPEIAAQVADHVPRAVIFTLKCAETQISKHLAGAKRTHQLHRIDIESEEIGAWDKVYAEIGRVLAI